MGVVKVRVTILSPTAKAFVLGGGLVGADQAVYDPSADLVRILLYLGGGFLALGLLLITAATLTLRK